MAQQGRISRTDASKPARMPAYLDSNCGGHAYVARNIQFSRTLHIARGRLAGKQPSPDVPARKSNTLDLDSFTAKSTPRSYIFSHILPNFSMKGHDRPYGCTFSTCNKTFGSKYAWKRHENSQHFHLETWRCDEERPEGGLCATVFYRRQVFQEHLVKVHQKEDEHIKSALDSCRIGRNCQNRFWCGFCNKIVDLRKRGIDAWTERFDHIEDHFRGRHSLPKQSIQDWVPLDSDKPKRDVGSPNSRGSPGEKGFTESASSCTAASPTSKSAGPSSPSGMNQASHPLPGQNANAEYLTPVSTAAKSAIPSKIPNFWHHDFEESASGTPQPGELAQLDGDLESTVPTDPTERTKSTWGNSSLSKWADLYLQICECSHTSLESFTTIDSKPGATLKLKSLSGTAHKQNLLAITSNKTNIPVEEGNASSSGMPVPALASLVAKGHEEGFLLGVYHKCSSILAKVVVIILKLQPKTEILDKKSASMLRSSSDLFFLWGENFQPADLDFIIEWSCDLKDAIIQYVMDISEALIKSK